MEVDKSLLMEGVQLQKMLGTLLEADEQCPKDLLDAEPHPTDQTLVMFADIVYIPKKSLSFRIWGSSLESDADYGTRILMDKLQGWKLLITATNTNVSNGYFGAAFVNTGSQQVVVAHRGTDPKHFGPLFTDIQGIFRTKYISCMTSAITFVDHIRQEINSANNQRRHYTLAITGHSLGAWLAQITTFSVKYLAISENRLEEKPEVGIHAKTVGFDSPGAREMLDRVLDDYYDRYAMNVYLEGLNITLYLSAPNHINTCGEHLGRIYRIFNNLSNFNVIDERTFIYTLTTHSMSNFVEALTAGENGTSNIGQVLDWPKNMEEFGELFKILKKTNNYNKNAEEDPEFLMEKVHRYKVLELKSPENINIFFKCHFRVFAEDELKMLYKLQALLEQKSELNVLNKLIRIKLDGDELEIAGLFPNFNIDHSNRTIECKPVETLAELKSPKNVEILKSCFKDFSEDKLQMLYNLHEQQEQKSDNTAHNLVQKNHKGRIAKFLPDFDMEEYNRRKSRKSLAALCNRLKQLMRWLKPEFTEAMDKQTKLFLYAADLMYFAEGKSYLNLLPKCYLDFEDPVDLQGFLDSDTERVLYIVTHSGDGAFQMVRLRNILHQIQRSNSSDGIIKYFNGSHYAFLGWPEIQKLHQIYGWPIGKEYVLVVDNISSSIALKDRTELINHVYSVSMKLILITPQPGDTPITSEIMKHINPVVYLKDLTLDSQNKLFERDNVIITGDRGFTFRQFFGDEFSLGDLNQILSSKCLKKFVTIENYAIVLKDTRPTFTDLQFPFFELNVKISKNLILSYVNSPNSNILVVINGLSREKLETGADWEQLNGKVILVEGDPELFFKNTCNKNQHKSIYLLEVSEGEVKVKQIFDKDFNMPRTFLHQARIDVQKFAKMRPFIDLFIICSDKDKTSLLELIDFRERKTFAENVHIATTKEAELEIIQKNKSKNIHFVKSMEKNEQLFEWRYSHGSVESLRYCVTMNSCDEHTLSQTDRNFVLIADEPGMGKTTSLACLSRLIKSSWVIYIEMKNFQAHIDRLPDRFTDTNVANFILSEYNNTDADGSFPHGILEYLLQSKTCSKQVVLMLNGFDEIDDYVTGKENAKEKVVRLLIFLKKKPSVQIFLTVRKYLKESLERKLSVFSTCFGALNSGEQRKFLVNIWKSCLSLELGGFGEEWKGRLRLYSEELLRQAKQVLGPDVDSFMEVPLQLRMLAEVFRPRIDPMTQHPELFCEQFDIISAPKLYKKYITLKYDIFINDKTLLGMLGDKLLVEDIFNDIAVKHGELGFRAFFSNFYQKNFVNISEEWLNAMNRHGLVQSMGNGNIQFVHRTYAEYFCAQMIVLWISQQERSQQGSVFKYQLIKEIFLSQILLHPGSKVIRMFVNFQLDEIAISETHRISTAHHIGQLWFENNSAFRNQEHQTAVHIAVQEKNEHIIKLLVSGLNIENTRDAFVSFITQYDIDYDTALHVMDKPTLSGESEPIGNKIMENIFNCIMTCSYEAKEKILFAYLFNRDVSESYISNYLLRLDNISGDNLTVFNKVVSRVREVETEIIPFKEALPENIKLVKEILLERLLLNNIERYCLILMRHKDRGMKTALHLAAQHGHLAALKLIKEQTSVLFTSLMARRDNKMSPLHTAAESRHLNIVQFLVECGADMNARCTIGKTALMYATLKGNSPIVKYLVEKGTDINSKDNFGRTALYSAAARPRQATDDLSDVRYLIDNGSDLNSRDVEGWSALHIAAANGNLSIVEYLIEKAAEIHSVGNDGGNALYVAAFRGHFPVVKYLLQKGVDPNWPDVRGYTALTWGSLLWKWDVVQVLLDGVADVNADGGAALTYAILAEEWPIVERLVDKGASIHESDILELENLTEFKERHPNYEFKPPEI